MKIKNVVYKDGFVEIEYSRGGNVWATLVIKPKDVIANFHLVQTAPRLDAQQCCEIGKAGAASICLACSQGVMN